MLSRGRCSCPLTTIIIGRYYSYWVMWSVDHIAVSPEFPVYFPWYPSIDLWFSARFATSLWRWHLRRYCPNQGEWLACKVQALESSVRVVRSGVFWTCSNLVVCFEVHFPWCWRRQSRPRAMVFMQMGSRYSAAVFIFIFRSSFLIQMLAE